MGMNQRVVTKYKKISSPYEDDFAVEQVNQRGCEIIVLRFSRCSWTNLSTDQVEFIVGIVLNRRMNKNPPRVPFDLIEFACSYYFSLD